MSRKSPSAADLRSDPIPLLPLNFDSLETTGALFPDSHEPLVEDTTADPMQQKVTGEPKKRRGRPKGNAKSNAKRCTEYRNRKKQEEEKVYSENASLKREREELMRTIADLENMAQAMQGEDYIDLSLENELLRKEIKRHRQFIDRVVGLAGDDDVVCLEDEKLRVIKSSVENSVGQMMGLFYASTTDETWRKAAPHRFMLCEDEAVEAVMNFHYQFLPTNAAPEDVTRINIRMDVLLPLGAELWVEQYEDISRDMGRLRRHFEDMNPGLEVTLEELLPYHTLKDRDEAIMCLRIQANKEGSDYKRQDVSVSGARTIQLVQGAVPEQWRHPEETFPAKAQIFVNSSCNTKPLEKIYPSPTPAERVREISLSSALFRHVNESLTRATSVASVPVRGGVFELEQGILQHDGSFLLGGQELAAAEWKRYYSALKAANVDVGDKANALKAT